MLNNVLRHHLARLLNRENLTRAEATELLEAMLQEWAAANGTPRVEVVNAAVPTWTTTQSLIQFVTRGIYLDPDVILVFEAINDNHLDDGYWLHHLPEVDYSRHAGFLERHSQLYCFVRNRIATWREALAVSSWRRSWELAASRGVGDPSAIEGSIPMAHSNSTQVFETDLTNFIAQAEVIVQRRTGSGAPVVETQSIDFHGFPWAVMRPQRAP